MRRLIQDSENLSPEFFERDLSNFIFVDDRQHKDKHDLKHNYLKEQGFTLETVRLLTGDYASENSTSIIDTKRLNELSLCLGKDYYRFRQTIEEADRLGYKFFLVVELDDKDPQFTNLEDFKNNWINPECFGNGKTRQPCPWYRALMCDPNDPECPCSKWAHLQGKHPITAGAITDRLKTLQTDFNLEIIFCDENQTGEIIEGVLMNENY